MTLIADLSLVFEESASRLRGVTKRKMFGCDAFFANASIFGLIWKTGRIGVRLPDAARYQELLGQSGAEPWSVYDKPGAKPMAHWVLVPESMHDDESELSEWIGLAHGFALAPPPQIKATKSAKPAVGTKAKPKAKAPVKTRVTAKTAAAKPPASKQRNTSSKPAKRSGKQR
jgi:TfoX/Sxy family transcriptional regulator of competence genes